MCQKHSRFEHLGFAVMKETGINWGYMTAGGILALVPVIIFTILVQKHLVKGLTLGAIK